MKLGSVPRVKCSACAETCSHKVLFLTDGIEHLRCSECGKVSVFAFEMVDGKEEGKKKEKRSSLDCVSILERQGSKSSKPYSIKKDFTDGDYISHSKFGNGYVLTVVPPNKMEVLFEDEKKLLICGPGSKSGATAVTKPKKKTPKKKTARKKAEAPSGDEPVKCPICGATVSPYNLSRNPEGQIVKCLNCPVE